MPDTPEEREARLQALREAIAMCDCVAELAGNADKQTANLCADAIRKLMTPEERGAAK